MSYRINRTDGELLVDLNDGIINTTSTDLTLIGKNYKGFGEVMNENFIKLLENFASTDPPNNPLVGQLWFDKRDIKLKVYDGITFRSATGTVVNSSQPGNLTSGDIWIDNENNKLYIFDGTDLTLVGPTYNAGQGKTGFETATQIDANDVKRTILKLFIGGTLYGIYSEETFYIPVDLSIPGLSVYEGDTNFPKRQRLFKGFNVANTAGETGTKGFWYNGTATSAKALVDDAGVVRNANNFLPSNSNGVTTGSIRIKNSAGLSIGVGDTEYSILKIVGTTTMLENQQSNTDLAVRVRQGSSFLNALYVDTSERHIGLWTTTPKASLDVNGNVNVRGTFTVEGDTVYVQAEKLQIQDYNIELGVGSDSSQVTDSLVDGGGIILRSLDGSKDFLWEDNSNAWTSNVNMNLKSSNENSNPWYKIDNTNLMNMNSLGTAITSALGLNRIGTLLSLQVDYLNLDSNTLTSSTNGLQIDAGTNQNISIISSGTKITGVTDPDNDQDVATKGYVDREIANNDLVTTLDITGLTDPDDINTNDGPINSIIAIFNVLRPTSTVENGTVARILTNSYSNSTVGGIEITVSTLANDPQDEAVLRISYESVTDALGTGTESVVQDIEFNNPASGAISLTVTRYVYTLNNINGVWTYTPGSRVAV